MLWALRIRVLATLAFPALCTAAGCGSAGGDGVPVVTADGGIDNATMGVDAEGGNLSTLITEWMPAQAARSLGFTGTTDAYYALYDAACQSVGDCVAPCVAAGGTMTSCATGSACVASVEAGAMECLPPTYWSNVDEAFTASDSTVSAAELVLVSINYYDALIVTNFGISIPTGATVTGIQFDVHRNADDGFAVDDSIEIVKGGVAVGDEHATSQPWSQDLEDVTYGGPQDTWGVPWGAADLRSSGFGISVAPKYTGPSAGNDRAHIDSVRARVFYAPP